LISSEILTEYFCCDYEKCKGICCVEGDAGAPVTMDEIVGIEDALDTVWGDLSASAQSVIDKQGVAYTDKDGDLVTSIVRGKDCVFTCYDGDNCLCALEKAYRNGKVRAIGVSNFQAGRFFDFAHYVDVKPMVNQLQCNTLIQQTAIEPILAEFGTRMMAWGPLGGQGVEGIVKSEELAAIGAKYGKSAAQVALRWLTQRGVVAIPKSSHKERMAQNFDIFDFTLTDDDMKSIAKLNQHDTGTIDFGDPQFVKYLIENYG
jgi:hypothetical protein